MNRRDFIKSTGAVFAASGLSSFLPFFAQAEDIQDQYLLMFEMGGGWDVSLSLDPWTAITRPDQSDYFIEYGQNELFNVGNVIYGPAMSEIKNVLSDFSVIRGVFLAPSDSGHGGAMAMMRSGNGSGKYPDLPVAFSSLENVQNLGALSTTMLNPGELRATTFSIDDLQIQQGQMVDVNLIKGSGALAQARKSRLALAPKFKEFGEVRTQLLEPSQTDFTLQRLASVVAAFKSGLSRAALIESNSNLDTHSNHEKTHLSEQMKNWKVLSQLVGMLKKIPANDGKSIFDKTTIVVYSEFSRTPALNSAKGKDHNPLMNSVLVSGPGFRKGVAVGGSRIVTRANSKNGSPYHIAVPCDFATGAPVLNRSEFDQGTMVFPEHVMASIADSMGLDRVTFRCAQATTPSIKAILSRA